MTLRAWTKDDVAKIAALEKRCFSDPWSEEMFLGSMRLPVFYSVLIEDEDELVGYACENILFEDAEIANVAVAPEYRRRGLGKALLTWLEQTARAQNAEKLFLEVRAGNTPAKTLYESFGFEGISVRKRYYEDGEDAIVMLKKL